MVTHFASEGILRLVFNLATVNFIIMQSYCALNSSRNGVDNDNILKSTNSHASTLQICYSSDGKSINSNTLFVNKCLGVITTQTS